MKLSPVLILQQLLFVRQISSARFGGVPCPCRDTVQTPVYRPRHNLNLTRSGTNNHWRSLSTGEMWSVLPVVKIRRAAALRTHCSRSRSCTVTF